MTSQDDRTTTYNLFPGQIKALRKKSKETGFSTKLILETMIDRYHAKWERGEL